MEKNANGAFQRKLDAVYMGLPGVTVIADDMAVYGKTEPDHDRKMIQFLETTRSNGLRLTKSKIIYIYTDRTNRSFKSHLFIYLEITENLHDYSLHMCVYIEIISLILDNFKLWEILILVNMHFCLFFVIKEEFHLATMMGYIFTKLSPQKSNKN